MKPLRDKPEYYMPSKRECEIIFQTLCDMGLNQSQISVVGETESVGVRYWRQALQAPVAIFKPFWALGGFPQESLKQEDLEKNPELCARVLHTIVTHKGGAERLTERAALRKLQDHFSCDVGEILGSSRSSHVPDNIHIGNTIHMYMESNRDKYSELRHYFIRRASESSDREVKLANLTHALKHAADNQWWTTSEMEVFREMLALST